MTQKDTPITDKTLNLEAELQQEIDNVTETEIELEADLENGQIYQAEEELERLR